ncbi:hypothetical protein PFHG_05577 [Plasmodium falciparum HB3]|uniref:Uncharacterized protein n=1 Tax=Plasmodium falciparum (isolate HB3) TaxID=137071 RepID=A0A0L7KMF0_PLAFX|nr:hypothetical protein PFHG_05493 [Plasmodium falciparum HB3]KOB64269.1 hypothetical protein PFHG_05577 [Plasmodium falciparum HB3]
MGITKMITFAATYYMKKCIKRKMRIMFIQMNIIIYVQVIYYPMKKKILYLKKEQRIIYTRKYIINLIRILQKRIK